MLSAVSPACHTQEPKLIEVWSKLGSKKKKKKGKGRKKYSLQLRKNLILSRYIEVCRAVIFLCDSQQPAVYPLIALVRLKFW